MKHFIVTAMLFLIIPTQARALSCISPDLNRSLSGAEIIFEGRITEVGGILTHSKINQLTAIVEKPYKGAKLGDEITIYKHHWINRQPNWTESDEEKKEGLFILSKTHSSKTPVGFLVPQDIYFFGMCSFPRWEMNDETTKGLETFLQNKSPKDVTKNGIEQN